ncbi:trehalase family glycosidase [Spirochaetia bacterium 38H-sp]|uniref:Trehalase family glycosidase n=1 Tax=Rarispira pelagica TaxID=3141764 RepID=A0ABU9U901_9SPIR
MTDSKFPQVHLYDQDLVELYNQSWALLEDFWQTGDSKNGWAKRFFAYSDDNVINLVDSCMSTFFLVYSNNEYPATPQLDNFYSKQEENGAIRANYRLDTGEPYISPDNPEGLALPLFAWAEYNVYHKIGNKKRIKEIMPVLQKYYDWLESNFRDETGLYHAPLAATSIPVATRAETYYPLDFNAVMALNAYYMAELGDLLNDKDLSFYYKKRYFALKTRINNMMWDEDSGLYYDLDKDKNKLTIKTLAGYWTLLTEIPGENQIQKLIANLKDPELFGTEHPFPVISVDDAQKNPQENCIFFAVYPAYTFVLIKGLSNYGYHEMARETAMRHLYFILDTLHPGENKKGYLWEAYNPHKEGPAQCQTEGFPKQNRILHIALSTITLMIENVIGLIISLPRKTVDWIIPTLEIMGIENLYLKRNFITILTNKNNMGWEIRLESEKLYYFTIDILGVKKKTLPIPSGKCSILIDKI